jgi:NIPSNAP
LLSRSDSGQFRAEKAGTFCIVNGGHVMIRSLMMSVVAIGCLVPAGAIGTAQEGQVAEARILEIRSYNLKPGMHERFRQLFESQASPMLERAGIDVVAFGPSLHEENSWFLMRSFPSIGDRRAREEAFYGSREWREGPRAAVLDCIESYTTVVMELDSTTIEDLRKIAGSE